MRIVFEKRKSRARGVLFAVPALSFMISLLLTGIVLLIAGADPFEPSRPCFWRLRLFQRCIGNPGKDYSLALTGLAVALAFKLRFWKSAPRDSSCWEE